MRQSDLELAGPDKPDALQWRAGWRDYLPAAGLVATMMMAWMTHLHNGMASWGVSAAALAQGKYATIPLHMFAHGGWSHILMNSVSLLEIGGLVVARLGAYRKACVRFFAVFGLSGLASMVSYLSFHPHGATPLIGASGAIYGVVGLLVFMLLSEELDPAQDGEIPSAVTEFLRRNLFFLLLLLMSSVLAGLSGGIAWEAHLGGFFFGFCIGPWIVPALHMVGPEI